MVNEKNEKCERNRHVRVCKINFLLGTLLMIVDNQNVKVVYCYNYL